MLARTIRGLTAILAFAVATSNTYAGSYQVIDLGVGGYSYDINNVNQVTGYRSVGAENHATLWNVLSNGSVTNHDLHADLISLPEFAGHANSYPYGINDAGQIAGWVNDGPGSTERGFLANPSIGEDYKVVNLHAAFGTTTYPFRRAYDINNSGFLVGVLNQPNANDPWPKAVAVDTNNMTMQSLAMGIHPHTTAYGIANSGQIVGYCEQNPRYYAASWNNSSASLVELNPAPADEGPTNSPSSWAFDVNDNGIVVGRSRGTSLGSNPSDSTATLWDTTTGGTPLDLDPTNRFRQSLAQGVNNSQQVVGWADRNPYTAPLPDYRAFLWESGTGLVDLNALIAPATGWLLQNATAINANGWITGVGVVGGQQHLFVLRPSEYDELWQGPPGGDWFDGSNWSPAGAPSGGTVILPGSGVVLSTSSPFFLASPTKVKVDTMTLGHSSGNGSLNVKYDPSALGVAGLDTLLETGNTKIGQGGKGSLFLEALTAWTAPPPGTLPSLSFKTNSVTLGETSEGKIELGGTFGAAASFGDSTIGSKSGGVGILSLDNHSWLQMDSLKIGAETGSLGSVLLGGGSNAKVGTGTTGDVAVGGDTIQSGGTGTLSVFANSKLSMGGTLTVWPGGNLKFENPDGTLTTGRVEASLAKIYGKVSGSGTLAANSVTAQTDSLFTVSTGKTLTIESPLPFNTSGKTELAGGIVNAPSGLNLLSGGKIEGFGKIQGNYQGATGSQLWAKGGVLEVGEANQVDGFLHAGTVKVELGAQLNLVSKTPALLSGQTELSGGTLASTNGTKIPSSSTLLGNGGILGSVWNQGKIAPGFSAGRLEFRDGLTLESTSLLDLELGGLVSGVEYDRIDVLGNLSIDGQLQVRLMNLFENDIKPEDTFTVLTATGNMTGYFTNVASGQRLGTVDGFGTFLVHYGPGSTYPQSVVLSNFVPVPEPSTFLLLAIACIGLLSSALPMNESARRKLAKLG